MKIEEFKHGSVYCFSTQIHCQNSPRHLQLHNLFMSLKSIELHWFSVLHHCVEAAERVRVAIDLKISLSCQKIYLWCHYILIFSSMSSHFAVAWHCVGSGFQDMFKSSNWFSWTYYDQNGWFSHSRSWKITKHRPLWLDVTSCSLGELLCSYPGSLLASRDKQRRLV